MYSRCRLLLYSVMYTLQSMYETCGELCATKRRISDDFTGTTPFLLYRWVVYSPAEILRYARQAKDVTKRSRL